MAAPVITALPEQDRVPLPPDLAEQHRLALTVPCPYCLALPGHRCHRLDGSSARYVELRLLHEVRNVLAQRATATVSTADIANTRPRTDAAHRRRRQSRPAAAGTRPLLYLDIDGPLNPWAAAAHELENSRRFLLAGRTGPPGNRHSGRTTQLWLNSSHGRQLFALTEIYDIVWASQWFDRANACIRPLLGLPRFPVLHWDPAGDDILAKARALVDHAGRRPFVWVDSRIDPAHAHYLNNAHTAPAYLYRIDPRRGLRTSDFVTLHAAAVNLTSEQRPAHWPTEPLLAPVLPAAQAPSGIAAELPVHTPAAAPVGAGHALA
ncbi:Uncharacterised protein [Nocardia africana]|uniref:Secreted protein n=2 Tax=Nocardiaceae TaxID=85025 RepID=A0A378X6T4_9NOCA|nr:Uncharacterised protein [Nocardia africana]